MSRPLIRVGSAQDAVAVAALEAQCLGPDAWSEGLVVEAVAGTLPTVHVLVAAGADVVGYAVVSAVEDVSELQRLAVAPDHRRSGLASGLVEAVGVLARQAGAQRMLLEVREDNAGARAFYAHAGFAEIARRARYFGDGTAAVVLERDLDPEP